MGSIELDEALKSDSSTDETANEDKAENKESEEGTKDEKQSEDSQEDQDKDEGESEKTKNFNEIPRFKELIKQKNEALKEKETTLAEKEQLQKELDELKRKLSGAEDKQKADENVGGFEDFKPVIDTKYSFKKPEEYPDIMSLYADMRAALIKDLTIIDRRERERVRTQEVQTQESVRKELDEVEAFFADDKDAKDRFLTYAKDKYQAGSKMSIMDMLDLWNDLAKDRENKRDSNTLNAIGSGKSASTTTSKEETYDPSLERNKSMFELGVEFLRKGKK